jgi:hypothetical protein
MEHPEREAGHDRTRLSEFINLAFASVIAVAVSSGCYDLIDTTIGLTLLALLWQYGAKSRPNRVNGLMWSAVIGLCMVLVVGVVIDTNFLPDTACTERPNIAFLVWLGSVVVASLYRRIEHGK